MRARTRPDCSRGYRTKPPGNARAVWGPKNPSPGMSVRCTWGRQVGPAGVASGLRSPQRRRPTAANRRRRGLETVRLEGPRPTRRGAAVRAGERGSNWGAWRAAAGGGSRRRKADLARPGARGLCGPVVARALRGAAGRGSCALLCGRWAEAAGSPPPRRIRGSIRYSIKVRRDHILSRFAVTIFHQGSP